MLRYRVLTVVLTAAACSHNVNPFLTASPLFDQAPPFDRIHDSDYEPALEEGMRLQLAEYDSIASQSAPTTFDNTLVPMEKSGEVLTRTLKVFSALNGANTNDTLQHIQEVMAPKLAAHHDAFYLNDRLFQRVANLYARRDSLGLNPEQRFLVERYYRDFVRAGAKLGDADKARLKALNTEEAKLTTS